MNIKTLLLIATLALAGFAHPKSYNVVLSAPAKAGSVQLAAGEYTVDSLGGIAVFANVETGKKFIVAVKQENAATKFDATSVGLKTTNGASAITSVELGGSSTVLELE